ncbi:cytochrome c peroxidase [Flavobacterium sp.]|uniref:cytochrome-c peroxidase n=1 Tax=Flavobacterium sp. TaxID=239 RepID=UPI00262151D5|nr:cytochrome c peroxidase [Flavobacterium sp.]
MTKKIIITFVAVLGIVSFYSFRNEEVSPYQTLYSQNLSASLLQQKELFHLIESVKVLDSASKKTIASQISKNRIQLKKIDFWLRYFEPNVYKKINGPLPVEWETEVFEKFEKPYKREGAGLTVAEIYMNGNDVEKNILLDDVRISINAIETYKAEAITNNLKSADVFYLCNRLYLLNLATIYSTGFECPNTENIIPELQQMLSDVNEIYAVYNLSFPEKKLPNDYLKLYHQAIDFVKKQPKDYTKFDHFTFIKDYVNPLFRLNQQYLTTYQVLSKSNMDYTLNDHANSIFDKSLFYAQNQNGIYYKIKDTLVLKEIDSIGKLLFYDPILSGNNQRSCVSCHKSEDYFTDTSVRTALQFNGKEALTRNTPSLLNVPYNHLIMLDGKLLTLQEQAKTVVTNPIEMGSNEEEMLQKVLSCPTYKKAFKKFAKCTPVENKISLNHIYSALTTYYSKYSQYYAPLDEAMNKNKPLKEDEIKGFNLFMGKAQCATCHFLPTFSGIKPPYIGNEFEVIGVPSDTTFASLDSDKGRYEINPATETMNAFRTTTIRNSEKTKPYMHNGVFKTLEEVINFYNRGAGSGHKLVVPNQTATADSLHLSLIEKKQLIRFIKSLNENIRFEKPPLHLPQSKINALNTRQVGGKY